MDIPTRNLSNYVRNKGINITKMSMVTGIPYGALYDSLLNTKRQRDLRLGEALSICSFLEVDPLDFADKESKACEKNLQTKS